MVLEQFKKDMKTYLVTVWCIEVIGEAAKNLDDETKSIYPDIPWKYIANMRNVLIHNYSGVDMEKVWDTVKNDIPDLLNKLK